MVDTAGGARMRYRLMEPIQVKLPETLRLGAAQPDCIEWPEAMIPEAEATASVAEFAPRSGVRLAYRGPRNFEVIVNGETHRPPALDIDLELVCLDRNGERISLTTQDFVTRIWDNRFTAPVGPPLDEKRSFGIRPTPKSTRSVVLTDDGSRALVRSFFWGPPNVAYWWFNLWDTGTALPLIDRKATIDWGGDPVPEDAVLDTSEAFLAFIREREPTRGAILEAIQIEPPPDVEAWLPDFAEAVGGMTFDDEGLPVRLSDAERARRLDVGLEQLKQHAAGFQAP